MNPRPATSALVFLLLMVVAAWPARAHEDLSEQLVRVDAELALSPDDPALWLERAELHRLHRDFTAARADVAGARDRGAPPERIALCEAALVLDEGRASAATVDLLLEQADPGDPGTWRVLRRVYQFLGRTEAADTAWTRYLTLDPKPDGYLDLADWRLRLVPPDTMAALAALHEGIRTCGAAPGLLMAACRLETAQGAPETALRTLDLAPAPTRLAPGFLELRGDVLRAAGRLPEARETYRRLLVLLDGMPPSRRGAPATANRRARAQAALAALPGPEDVR